MPKLLLNLQLFGEEGEELFDYFDDEWGGSCYGMAASSAMLDVRIKA